jgi:hypothetical protein
LGERLNGIQEVGGSTPPGSTNLEGLSFTREGNDEMDEASGDGWVKLQKDGSLKGEIRFHNGDDSTFKARPR